MTRRLFDSGTLLVDWDDAALIHGELVNGKWVTRVYTAEEAAAVTPTQPAPDPVEVEVDDLTVAVLVAL